MAVFLEDNMVIHQFVMAYEAEQDRLRALLPESFVSLRPVLRINAEIIDDTTAYLEFNTPVEAFGKRGWINIANWSSDSSNLSFEKNDRGFTFRLPFLSITFSPVGIIGGCPAEKDNEGCFFPEDSMRFRPAETVTENKEFCDCSFSWSFHKGDAYGKSLGKTLPAFPSEQVNFYPRLPLTAENAAAIPCRQVLGSYSVKFRRSNKK